MKSLFVILLLVAVASAGFFDDLEKAVNDGKKFVDDAKGKIEKGKEFVDEAKAAYKEAEIIAKPVVQDIKDTIAQGKAAYEQIAKDWKTVQANLKKFSDVAKEKVNKVVLLCKNMIAQAKALSTQTINDSKTLAAQVKAQVEVVTKQAKAEIDAAMVAAKAAADQLHAAIKVEYKSGKNMLNEFRDEANKLQKAVNAAKTANKEVTGDLKVVFENYRVQAQKLVDAGKLLVERSKASSTKYWFNSKKNVEAVKADLQKYLSAAQVFQTNLLKLRDQYIAEINKLMVKVGQKEKELVAKAQQVYKDNKQAALVEIEDGKNQVQPLIDSTTDAINNTKDVSQKTIDKVISTTDNAKNAFSQFQSIFDKLVKKADKLKN